MLDINIVSSVFSLADGILEKETLDSGNLDLGLVSAGSNGFGPWASLWADNVTISFSLLSIPCMRNPVVYRIGPQKQ